MTTQIYKSPVNKNRRPIERFFLIIVLLELFFMGSGRIIQFGPLTLKMILYLIATGYSIFLLLWWRSVGFQIVFLTVSFLSMISLSAFVGCISNADLSLLIGDVKQLSFFLIGVFFWLTINSIDRVYLTARLIKISSLLLAIAYLSSLIMILLGIINFKIFYSILNATGEVYFRGTSGFFYKGFLYMCVGFIFYLLGGGIRSKGIALLIFTAIIMTFTRGFLLAIGLTGVIYLLVFSKRSFKTILYLMIFCVLGVFLVKQYLSIHANVLGSTTTSDMIRIITMQQVWEALNPLTILIGHGFGIGVPQKPIHMEIAYLEMFHKQGIIGLIFWFAIFIMLIRWYYSAVSKGNRNIALPFLMSCIFIYIESMTNPFLNNPIGMSMILISIAVLNVLRKVDQRIIVENQVNFSSGYISDNPV